MTWAAYILPVAFIGVILIAALRKVRVYDSFAEGIKGAIPLVLSLFPYIAAILILTELFDASGLSDRLNEALSPAFSFLGIPPEISRLVLLKPFSGSGSTAVLSEIFAKYGADSYISRCAAVVYASAVKTRRRQGRSSLRWRQTWSRWRSGALFAESFD